MSITRDFKLSLVAGRSVPLVINANQYDDGEIWRFTLLDENGQKYSPSTGSIIGLKSDGHIIANAGTVSSTGLVIIPETEQMTASPGKNIYELLIDDDTHGTANFIVFVEPRPGADGTPSDSDLAVFQEAIDAAAQIGDASELVDDVAVLKSRMDEFTTLTDGSTTGDAELADIRVGADGTTYPNAGDAVRGQVSDLKNAIDDVIDATSTTSDINFSDFTSGITSGIWRSEKLYSKGYIDKVTAKISDNSTQNVILTFIDPDTNVVTHSWFYPSQSGQFDMPVDIVMKKDFCIGIYCSKLGYKSGSNAVYQSTVSSAPVGTDVTGTLVGNYDLAVQVNYKTITNRVTDSVHESNTYDIILDTSDLSLFTNKLLSGWWWTDYQYEGGFIDHVTLKGTTDGIGNKCGLMIIDSVTNKVLFVENNYVQDSSLETVIPVKVFSENPVYIAVNGVNLGYTSTGVNRQYIRNTSLNPTINESISFTWTGTANYKFGVKVTYSDIPETEISHLKLRNKMFICGDSITAGYPFNMNPIIEGLRYGDAIGRTLDYDVTFGAQSGNGWLYTSGSAYAYSITNSTDFSQYDVALYAWGTNDYAHDMPLGDINDTYASQTVCGTMNYCIDKIYNDNPNIVLIISTPLNRTYSDGYGYTKANAQGYTLKQMVDKMIELCEARGIAFIDNTCSPFNPKSLGGLTGDGLHPSRIGYQVLGAYMSSKVGALIQPYVSAIKGL